MPPLFKHQSVGREVIWGASVDSFLCLIVGMPSDVFIGKIGSVEILLRFSLRILTCFCGWGCTAFLAARFAFWHSTVCHSTFGDTML